MYYKDIIGLNEIKYHLINSVQKGFIPHALIFYGTEGIGKLPLAIAYARYLNCLSPTDVDSCGKCSSCLKYDKLAHPDLHFAFPMVQRKSEKKIVCDDYISNWRSFLNNNYYFTLSSWLQYINAKNSQGVIYSQESEEIIRKLSLKAYEGKYKIMIVWLPEKMNLECANKLLKIIEEPPAKTIFLLISEDMKNVISTVKSRCQPIFVRNIKNDEMVKAVHHNYGLQLNDALAVAHISGGSYTKAMEVIESTDESRLLYDLFLKMLIVASSRQIKKIKEIADELAKVGREKQKEFLEYSLRMFREFFISTLNVSALVYLNLNEKQINKEFKGIIHEKNIEILLEEFSMAYKQIEQNGNAKIIFLDLCLKLTMLIKQ